MNQEQHIPRGAALFREGDKTGTVFLIQSGQVSVCLTRGKSSIELYRATAGMVLGTEAIVSGILHHTVSAIALADTKVLPVSVDIIKNQLETMPQLQKFILKGAIESSKHLGHELRGLRAEQDPSPMPADHVAKVFGSLYHAAKSMGTTKEGHISGQITVPWPALRKYTTRVFLESPIRLELAAQILKKLKICDFEMAPDETDAEGGEILAYVHFKSLAPIERFFDYYQNYHFKGQGGTTLKFDEKSLQVGFALRKAVTEEPIDANGIVTANFGRVVERLKTLLTSTVSVDTLAVLEAKGLNINRKADKDGGTIQFYMTELEGMLSNWMILREVEHLNEVGSVTALKNIAA